MGRRILLAILTLFVSATAAAAQETTGGRIIGRVSAVDGRALSGIQVSVSGTLRGAVSDSAGRFTITNVAPGVRTVLARSMGYAQATMTVTVPAEARGLPIGRPGFLWCFSSSFR
jgi:iron complex outermembrane receptor protein